MIQDWIDTYRRNILFGHSNSIFWLRSYPECLWTSSMANKLQLFLKFSATDSIHILISMVVSTEDLKLNQLVLFVFSHYSAEGTRSQSPHRHVCCMHTCRFIESLKPNFISVTFYFRNALRTLFGDMVSSEIRGIKVYVFPVESHVSSQSHFTRKNHMQCNGSWYDVGILYNFNSMCIWQKPSQSSEMVQTCLS